MSSKKNVLFRWSGDDNVTFYISKKKAELFEDLNITGELTTEDKATGQNGYKSIKNSKPYKITLKADLYAAFGIDVKTVAMAMVKAAHTGKSGYIYMGKKKLVSMKMLMTKAQVSDVEMTASGTWTACNVSLTFEQGEVGDGVGGGDTSNPGKKGSGYAGYCVWSATANNNQGAWVVIAGTPANASAYTETVTINGKKYHGYKATTAPATDTEPESERQYDQGLHPTTVTPTKRPTRKND